MATVDETAQKLQRILIGEFNDVRLLKNGGFSVPLGSSTAFVEPVEWNPDKEGNPRTLVRIWAPLGRDVTPTPELYQWAATDGQNLWFGRVAVRPGKDDAPALVVLDHTLLGDYIDPAELLSAVYAVMSTANDLDEVVHDRFGGKRYTDPD